MTFRHPTGFSDAFTRANDATGLGADYLADPLNDGSTDFRVNSNAASGQGATNSNDHVVLSAQTYARPCGAGLTVSTTASPADFTELRILLCFNDSATAGFDGYRVVLYNFSGTPELEFLRFDNGVENTLGVNQLGLPPLASGDRFAVTLDERADIQAWRRDVGTGVWAPYGAPNRDGTYASGAPGWGLFENNRTAILDDFFAGSIAELGRFPNPSFPLAKAAA